MSKAGSSNSSSTILQRLIRVGLVRVRDEARVRVGSISFHG